MEQWVWIAIAGVGLLAVLFFYRQLRFLLLIVRNAIVGGLGLFVVNWLMDVSGIYDLMGMAVGINPVTVFVVGVLGVPGFALLYLTQWMVL